MRGVRGEAFIVEMWTENHDGARSPGSEIGGQDFLTCHFRLRYTPSGAAKVMETELIVREEEYTRWNETTQKHEDREVGERVEILYLPDNPQRVETVYFIENSDGGLAARVILIIFGVLVLGLSLLGVYLVLFVGPAP